MAWHLSGHEHDRDGQPSQDTCETIQPLLSLQSDGMASPEEVTRIDAHLAGCADCRQAQAWIQATNQVLSQRPVALPPPDLRARIAAAIAASEEQATLVRPPRRAFRLRPAYAAAASLALVAAVATRLMLPTHEAGTTVVTHPVTPPVVASAPHHFPTSVARARPPYPTRTARVAARPTHRAAPALTGPKPQAPVEIARTENEPESEGASTVTRALAPAVTPPMKAVQVAQNKILHESPRTAFTRPSVVGKTSHSKAPGSNPIRPETVIAKVEPTPPEIKPPVLPAPPVPAPAPSETTRPAPTETRTTAPPVRVASLPNDDHHDILGGVRARLIVQQSSPQSGFPRRAGGRPQARHVSFDTDTDKSGTLPFTYAPL